MLISGGFVYTSTTNDRRVCNNAKLQWKRSLFSIFAFCFRFWDTGISNRSSSYQVVVNKNSIYGYKSCKMVTSVSEAMQLIWKGNNKIKCVT